MKYIHIKNGHSTAVEIAKAAQASPRRYFSKLANALNPGRHVIIHCYNRTEPPDEFSTMFSWIVFQNLRGRTYTYDEISTWLTEEGFSDYNRIDLPPAGQKSIVTAVKIG